VGGDRRGRPGDKLTAPGGAARWSGRSPPGRHVHPDGSSRSYSRGTIDRWLRAWRQGRAGWRRSGPGGAGGQPGWCVAPPGAVRRGRAALRLELPGRSAAPDRLDLVSPGTGYRCRSGPSAGQLRRAGLHRRGAGRRAEGLTAGMRPARPNERWITDVLVGPRGWPVAAAGTARCGPRLFLIVDDHSRPAGRWPVLTAGRTPGPARGPAAPGRSTRRGLPRKCSTLITGAPFFECVAGPVPAVFWASGWCIRKTLLAGRAGEAGKAQPLYIREAFLAEAVHRRHRVAGGAERLVSRRGAEQVANRRVHAEDPGRPPIGPVRRRRPRTARPAPDLIREAFRWSVTRRGDPHRGPSRLEGNAYGRGPGAGRPAGSRLRYDPEGPDPGIEVYLDGKPAGGRGLPFVTRRHVPRAVPQAARPPNRTPPASDYLGLVAAAHDEEAGTGAKIDFTPQLGKLPRQRPGPVRRGGERRAVGRALRAGPPPRSASPSPAPGPVSPARLTPRRSPGSASAWWNQRWEWSRGTSGRARRSALRARRPRRWTPTPAPGDLHRQPGVRQPGGLYVHHRPGARPARPRYHLKAELNGPGPATLSSPPEDRRAAPPGRAHLRRRAHLLQPEPARGAAAADELGNGFRLPPRSPGSSPGQPTLKPSGCGMGMVRRPPTSGSPPGFTIKPMGPRRIRRLTCAITWRWAGREEPLFADGRPSPACTGFANGLPRALQQTRGLAALIAARRGPAKDPRRRCLRQEKAVARAHPRLAAPPTPAGPATLKEPRRGPPGFPPALAAQAEAPPRHRRVPRPARAVRTSRPALTPCCSKPSPRLAKPPRRTPDPHPSPAAPPHVDTSHLPET